MTDADTSDKKEVHLELIENNKRNIFAKNDRASQYSNYKFKN